MDTIDYSGLSEQTKLEMELGRKMAAANAAAFEVAQKAREAESVAAPVDNLSNGKEPVFPLAKEPIQPKKGAKRDGDQV